MGISTYERFESALSRYDGKCEACGAICDEPDQVAFHATGHGDFICPDCWNDRVDNGPFGVCA